MVLELDPRKWFVRPSAKAFVSSVAAGAVRPVPVASPTKVFSESYPPLPKPVPAMPQPPKPRASSVVAQPVGRVVSDEPADVAQADGPAGAVESDMNIAALLALILKLAIPTVLTVQQVIGDAQSGADKKTMAQDALAGATQAALGVVTGENAQLAQAAAAVASTAIDAAVSFTKATGSYQAATAAAKAAAPAAAATTATAALAK